MIKKICTGLLILLLVTRVCIFVPVLAHADDPIDTPTPTLEETPSPTPDDSVTPTPSPDSVSPSPTPDSSTINTDATDSATVDNTITAEGTSGANTVATTDGPTPTGSDPTPTPDTSVTTGDSVATTTADNSVNTTSVNSQVIYQTINIFIDQSGNIDLSAPIAAAEQVASNTSNTSADVVMTDVNNYATVDNAIDANADSGDNTTTSDGQVVVNTGNAYAIAQLINKVNVTLVDSTIHIVTINIYGNLNGNIILPQLQGQTTCTSCTVNLQANSTADVTNTVTGTATSGNNTILSTGSATLATGNSIAIVNLTNLINLLLYGSSFGHIYINTFGTWDGSFLGWDGSSATQQGNTLDIVDMPQDTTGTNETNDSVQVNNTAIVHNTVEADAISGNNTTVGTNAQVTTGNAYAFVSLVNFINAIFVKSTGFLGFINIFGNLHGNIGGSNYFPTPTPPVENALAATTSTETHLDEGGQLAVTTHNNAGTYLLPGDTVTLFADVTNPGTGKVYNAVLHVSLIHNGQEQGAQDIQLGDIAGGKTVKVTTGIVLSSTVPPGLFIARMTASGTTGDAATPISAYADSTFAIFNSLAAANTNTPTPASTILGGHKAILGASTKSNPVNDTPLYWALLFVLLAYVVIRAIRAREQLVLLFTPGANFKSRLNMLRLFLL